MTPFFYGRKGDCMLYIGFGMETLGKQDVFNDLGQRESGVANHDINLSLALWQTSHIP